MLPGARAAFLGGAFTAVADDGSAAWYNPAGLSQVPRFTVSLAADAYGMHLLDRAVVVNPQGDLHTLRFRWFGAIPTTFAVTLAPRPGLTLGVAVVGADRFRISALTTTEGVQIADTFFGQRRTFTTLASKASIEAATTLVGPAFGLELGAGFSVGLSLFYQLTQVARLPVPSPDQRAGRPSCDEFGLRPSPAARGRELVHRHEAAGAAAGRHRRNEAALLQLGLDDLQLTLQQAANDRRERPIRERAADALELADELLRAHVVDAALVLLRPVGGDAAACDGALGEAVRVEVDTVHDVLL